MGIIGEIDVEYAKDWVLFNKLSTVKIKGSKLDFSYKHNIVLGQGYYCRLKLKRSMNDIDYSQILYVKGLEAQEVLVYPNPTSLDVNLVINSEKLIGTKAVVIDVNGKKMKTFLIKSKNNYLKTNELEKGVYFY